MTARRKSCHHIAVIEATAAYVRIHGRKRGLHLASQAIGMGERAVERALAGEEFAADAERAAKANETHLRLLRDYAAELRRRADELQRRMGVDGTPVDGARMALSGGGGLVPATGGRT
jgi:hypothetical protein